MSGPSETVGCASLDGFGVGSIYGVSGEKRLSVDHGQFDWNHQLAADAILGFTSSTCLSANFSSATSQW